MKLENQVCSPEQAIKLKELGISQESLYYLSDTRKSWKDYNQVNGEFIPFANIDLENDELEISNNIEDAKKFIVGYNKSEPISLFTVAELGVMLTCFASELKRNYDEDSFIGYIAGEEACIYGGFTEASARAEWLIWLIQNKRIPVYESNKALTTP